MSESLFKINWYENPLDGETSDFSLKRFAQICLLKWLEFYVRSMLLLYFFQPHHALTSSKRHLTEFEPWSDCRKLNFLLAHSSTALIASRSTSISDTNDSTNGEMESEKFISYRVMGNVSTSLHADDVTKAIRQRWAPQFKGGRDEQVIKLKECSSLINSWWEQLKSSD